MFSVRLSNVLGSWQQPLVAFAVLDTSKILQSCRNALAWAVCIRSMHALLAHHRTLWELVIACFLTALLQEHGRAAACAAISEKDPSESC